MKQKSSGFGLMLNLAPLFCKPYFCGMMDRTKGTKSGQEEGVNNPIWGGEGV